MAINIEDRRKIKDFVNNQHSLANSTVHTMGGPCADWVATIIEEATGCQILDKEGVFNNNISRIYRGVLIPDYATLLQTVQDGDILYVVDSYTGNTTHYMLFCNVVVQNQGLHVQKNSLGVNGGFCLNSVAYKNVIASEISGGSFNGFGYLRYDNMPNAKHYLYKVDYDLV